MNKFRIIYDLKAALTKSAPSNSWDQLVRYVDPPQETFIFANYEEEARQQFATMFPDMAIRSIAKLPPV